MDAVIGCTSMMYFSGFSKNAKNIYTNSFMSRSTIPFKIKHAYVIKKFLTAHFQVQQNIYDKTAIEVCRPYLYASFGTFCTQISQLFESQGVRESLKYI